MKNYVVYLTHYSGNKLPNWYIGSSFKTKILNGYNGSVRSKKWSEIYLNEQKQNKHLFKTKILSYHVTRKDALKEELRLQEMHSVVKNKKYFNESYATINGFFGRDVSGTNNPMYGRTHSEETKEKLKYERTNETKIKLSESMQGRIPWMKGKRHSEETKKKMSESTNHNGENNPFYGKTHSLETIEKIRQSNKGRKDSEETRKRKSESRKGNKNPMYGVKRPRIICEYCNKDIDTANYKRWDGFNCKEKSY